MAKDIRASRKFSKEVSNIAESDKVENQFKTIILIL